jgi:endonuclease III-like uncharacterized protein
MVNNIDMQIDTLAQFIQFVRPSFTPFCNNYNYNHMGATLTDAVLQAGLNYKTVVYPRVMNVKENYSTYNTTSEFIKLINIVPLERVIKWSNSEKVNRLRNLIYFMAENEIENEIILAEWLNENNNIEKMLELKGIGPKTVDYLKKLIGMSSIPIDRHLFKFLEIAGVETQCYSHANHLYSEVSKILNIDKVELDYNIWTLMSSISTNKRKSMAH